MPYCKRIYIFIEGDADKRFFEEIIKNLILKKRIYEKVHIRQWRQKKEEVVCNLIHMFEEKECKVVFVRDYDKVANNPEHIKSNISLLKEETVQKYKIKSKNDIYIVIRKIEGWYLAGIKNSLLKKYNIKPIENTININKKHFDKLKPKGMSKSEFFIEITKNFSVKNAKKKNSSFRFFLEKMRL